jgi:hypothetical protein
VTSAGVSADKNFPQADGVDDVFFVDFFLLSAVQVTEQRVMIA